MIYVKDFYARSEADALLEFIKTLPSVRPKNKRNDKSFLRRLSFPGYSPSLDDSRTASRYHICGPVLNAPQLYQELSSRLTAFAGKEVNYLSTIGYLPDDHMNFHQHAEDMKREDQTVYVLSLGAVHPVAIRYGATVGKKFVPNGRQEIFYPSHGSLYVLPSAFNTPGSGQEAQHAVLEGNDYSHNGLRVSINCKHIPPGLSPEEMKKACSRPAGRSNSQSGSLEVGPARNKSLVNFVSLDGKPKPCGCRRKIASVANESRPRGSRDGRSRQYRCTRISVVRLACITSIWFAKFANSEPKTEFQPHGYERTALLREVARGFPAIAWAGVEVPPNRGGSEHFREDGHGMARGARPAPATKRKTPPETSRVSTKDMSGSSRGDFKPGAGWLIPYPPITVPTQALRQG